MRPAAQEGSSSAAVATGGSSGSSGSSSSASEAAAPAGEQQGGAAPPPPLELTVSLASGAQHVGREEWDACATGGGAVNPFVLHDFLAVLEESGSAVREEGWLPQHVLVRRGDTGELLGCAPCYLKAHSYGEYVFDQVRRDLGEVGAGHGGQQGRAGRGSTGHASERRGRATGASRSGTLLPQPTRSSLAAS